MKNLTKILLASGIAFILASCGTMNDPYGKNYPNKYPHPNDRVIIYRAPDGGIFRQGEIYRDRNGNVYQNGRIIRTGDIYGQPGILGRNGAILYPGINPRNLPPGQAKKIYGGEAKDYAPGQVKKRYVGKGKKYNDGGYDDGYNKEHHKKGKKH